MNASTSALGRALGMMGFGIDHKMASKQEVMARQEQPRVEIARYDDGEPIPDPFTGEPQTNVGIALARSIRLHDAKKSGCNQKKITR